MQGSWIQYVGLVVFTDTLGVIVFNPNQNSGPEELETVYCDTFIMKAGEKAPSRPHSKKVKIPGSESNVAHTLYVWDHFVAKAEAKLIGCVAHSAGGGCVQSLVDKRGM